MGYWKSRSIWHWSEWLFFSIHFTLQWAHLTSISGEYFIHLANDPHYRLRSLFVVLYGYRRQKIKDLGSEDCTNLRDTQEYLRNLQAAFIDASSQFSIIVAVAGAVRLRRSPPFFEVAFLQSLALVQFLGLFAVVFASGVAVSKPRDSRRVTVLCFYMSILFCFGGAMFIS